MKSLLRPLALALSFLSLPVAAAQHPVLLYDEEVTAVQDELLEGVPADFDQDGAWDIASIGTYTMLHWQVADDVWLDRIVGQGDDRVHPADLDGDGLLDLVAVQGMEVGWYRQVADRRFDPFMSLGSLLLPGSTSTGLEITGLDAGDFDADGNVDVAAVARVPLGMPEPGVLVILGPATGSASQVVPIGFAGGVEATAVADLDGDGDEDLVVARLDSITGLAFQGGFWTAIVNLSTPTTAASQLFDLSVADLDGDGTPDYAVAGAGGASVLLSTQSHAPSTLMSPSGGSWYFADVEAGQFDGSNMAIAVRGADWYWFENRADVFTWDPSSVAMTFSADVDFAGVLGHPFLFRGSLTRMCATRRASSSGPDHLVVGYSATTCGSAQALSMGTLGGEPAVPVHNLYPNVQVSGRVLFDRNGDGYLDVSARGDLPEANCDWGFYPYLMTILRQSGAWGGEYSGSGSLGVAGRSVAGDLLNDGRPSWLILRFDMNSGYREVHWKSPELAGTSCSVDYDSSGWGLGPWAAVASGVGAERAQYATSFSGWGTCEWPSIGFGQDLGLLDYDWDGDADFLLDDLLIEATSSGLLSGVPIAGIAGLERVLRDLDGDVRLDIVTASSSGVAWLRNQGDLGFGAPQLLWPGVQDFEVMDIDQDGVVDLIGVAASGLQYLPGLGGGSFGVPVDLPLLGQTVPLVASLPEAADFDRDGDIDLLVKDTTGPRVRYVAFMNQAGPHDCDGSGVADHEEIAAGVHEDTDRNGQPDRCDIAAGRHDDQNQNGVPDACEYVGEPWWIPSPINGHRYASTPPLSADEARTLARAWGGSLVTIRSAAEQAWLQERFGTPADPVWIGLSDRQDEGQFRWHSKESSAFTSWAPGTGVPGNPDDVLLDPASGEWFEADAALTFVAIVEQGDCDGDGEVDALQIELDPTLDWDGNGLLDSCTGLAANYCNANVNMDGLVGRISVAGSPLIGLNSLELMASEVPTNQFGYFVFSRTQGYLNPFGGGQGALCIAAPIRRLSGPGQVLNTGTAGETTLPVDLTSLPSGVVVLAGESLNFQFWHREYDTFGNPTSNTTDAIEVCFR